MALKPTDGILPRFAVGLQILVVLFIIAIGVFFAWQSTMAVKLLREAAARQMEQAEIENAALGDVLNGINNTQDQILKAIRGLHINCQIKGKTQQTFECRLVVPKPKATSSRTPTQIAPTPTRPPPPPNEPVVRRTLPPNCKIVGPPGHHHLVCTGKGGRSSVPTDA